MSSFSPTDWDLRSMTSLKSLERIKVAAHNLPRTGPAYWHADPTRGLPPDTDVVALTISTPGWPINPASFATPMLRNAPICMAESMCSRWFKTHLINYSRVLFFFAINLFPASAMPVMAPWGRRNSAHVPSPLRTGYIHRGTATKHNTHARAWTSRAMYSTVRCSVFFFSAKCFFFF